MNNHYLHLFIYLEDKSSDKYFGIKKQLSRFNGIEPDEPRHFLKDIRFSVKSQEIFNKVEYSSRKLFREFFYKKVFKDLEKKIISTIKKNNKDYSIIIYTQDEGVWSEFLRFLIKKYQLNNITFVNVQHGFLLNYNIPKDNFFRTRIIKFINYIYTSILGFPKFGIGPFSGPFDYYLLFHKELYKNVISHAKAIACPNLINRFFIDNFLKTEKEKYEKNSVLIALPYFISAGSTKFETLNFEKTMISIKKMIKGIKNNFDFKIYLRRHPNMDRKEFFHMIKKIDIYEDIIEDKLSIEKSIYRSPIVFSFFSTALFEAKLVNRLPIVMTDNSKFDSKLFPIKYESIDLTKNIKKQFEHILTMNTNFNDYKNEINWKDIVEKNI